MPKPTVDALPQRLQLQATVMTPQAMLRARVALDQAQRNQPGGVVEVIGYDDGAALKLLSLTVAERARREFNPMDKQGQKELYAFMHRDPAHPTPFLQVPMLAGGKANHAEDAWLK